jgi:hypothetical protein
MNYHLHKQGQSLGVFPLEELQRRRNAGELDGTEHVWCEGMPDWAPIDTILQPVAPAPRPISPPPLPASSVKRGSNRTVIWVVAGLLVLFVVIVTVVGIVSARIGSRFLPILNQAARSSGRDDMAAASKPVSWTTNTLTELDVQKRSKEFRLRQWLQGYEQRGQHDQPCDVEARQFLETWIARNYGGDVATNLPSNQQWADKLAAMPGCDDPLLLTAVAACTTNRREKTARLERALAGFQNSKHKGYPKFYAAVILASELTDEVRIQQIDSTAIQFLKEAFSDGGLRTEDQAELGEILINGWGYNFFNRNRETVCKIVEDSGKPFHWLALVLRGEFHIIEAWLARGGGYADSVNAEGWRGFSTHLVSARKSLTEAWKLKPALPLAPERMIYVSLGDSAIEEMRTWFDRTVTAQIDYPRAWTDLRWGLRPRWYGTPDSILAFGLAALDTKRFDTDVPRKFFDSLSDLKAEEEPPAGESIYARPDIWPHVEEMYEGYIAAPSQAASRDGWRSSYFVVAYLAGKYDVARAQLEALNWKPWSYNLTGWGTDLSLAPLEVAARTGSAGTQIARAEAASGRGEIAEALAIYTNLPATKTDERTLQFVRQRVTILEKQKHVQSGEWMDFLPVSETDPAWEFLRGDVRRMSDGDLEVKCGPTGHFLFCQTQIGPDFEIRGEFDAAHSSTGNFQAGLVMGHLDLNTRNWYALRLIKSSGNREYARLSRGWAQPENDKPVPLKNEGNSFDVRFQNGRFTVVINGQKVFDDAAPPQEISVANNQFLVGFGAYNNRNETVILYRKVQIRKLPPGKP